MGCCGSHQQPPSPTTRRHRYDEFAALITDPLRGPTMEDIRFIKTCSPRALEPKDKDATKLPLLVLAKDHDDWFRCLSKRCDPGVTWKQDGEEKRLGVELMGHRLYNDWCFAMECWEARHATTNSTGRRPLDSPQRNDWWSLGEYGGVSVALGLSAFATVSLGCPLVCVGPVIWTVIKAWRESFKRCRPSPKLTKIFSTHETIVGSVLKELDTRIKAAEEVAKANPGHRPSIEKSARQRLRMDGLRTILESDTRKMESIARGRASDDAKCEQMTNMLRTLLDFERELHKELMEEERSSDLQKVVDALKSIEESLLGASMTRSSSMFLDDLDGSGIQDSQRQPSAALFVASTSDHNGRTDSATTSASGHYAGARRSTHDW
ncbi:unnamed protein product [Ectocarpus sp. 12 AP-2014]